MCIYNSIFKIEDINKTIENIESCNDIELFDIDKENRYYYWLRKYPKNHWSPVSKISGARQVLGHITINKNEIMKLETKTKGWMVGLIRYMLRILGDELYLYDLEFLDPLEVLYNK